MSPRPELGHKGQLGLSPLVLQPATQQTPKLVPDELEDSGIQIENDTPEHIADDIKEEPDLSPQVSKCRLTGNGLRDDPFILEDYEKEECYNVAGATAVRPRTINALGNEDARHPENPVNTKASTLDHSCSASLAESADKSRKVTSPSTVPSGAVKAAVFAHEIPRVPPSTGMENVVPVTPQRKSSVQGQSSTEAGRPPLIQTGKPSPTPNQIASAKKDPRKPRRVRFDITAAAPSGTTTASKVKKPAPITSANPTLAKGAPHPKPKAKTAFIITPAVVGSPSGNGAPTRRTFSYVSHGGGGFDSSSEDEFTADQPRLEVVRKPGYEDQNTAELARTCRSLIEGKKAGWLSPAQRDSLACVLEGDEDMLVVLPTGGGKSLLFLGPAKVELGVTVIIVPFVPLQKDLYDRGVLVSRNNSDNASNLH